MQNTIEEQIGAILKQKGITPAASAAEFVCRIAIRFHKLVPFVLAMAIEEELKQIGRERPCRHMRCHQGVIQCARGLPLICFICISYQRTRWWNRRSMLKMFIQ
jgi:hypothetical protein